MSLSAKQKAALCEATAQTAEALIEDIVHIRDVLRRRESSKGELRRLSAVMRRLLVDGDLSSVAAPRFRRLTISSPDLATFYDVEKAAHILFFESGGAPVFGTSFHSILMVNAGQVKIPEQNTRELAGKLRYNDRVDLRIDNL
jgi:hypothetical protein